MTATEIPSAEAAENEVQLLYELEARWTDVLAAKLAARDALRQRAGADLLTQDPETALQHGASHPLAELGADIDLATSAIDAARLQRREALLVLPRAEAVELRRQADELDQQAAERQVRTDELLAGLLEHEGVHYIANPNEAADGYAMVRKMPETWSLRERVKVLRLEANRRVNNAKIDDSGSGTWSTDIGILGFRGGAHDIVPTLMDRRAWLAEVQPPAMERIQHAGLQTKDVVVGFVLVWKNGAIDRQQSHVDLERREQGVPAGIDPFAHTYIRTDVATAGAY